MAVIVAFFAEAAANRCRRGRGRILDVRSFVLFMQGFPFRTSLLLKRTSRQGENLLEAL